MSSEQQVLPGAMTPVRSLPWNSVWLLAAKGLQMGAGFLFWVAAARTASVSDVGVAAATVSAVMLCTQLGILGTGSAVIIALGRGEPRTQVLDTAFTIVGGAAVVSAVGYVMVTRASGSRLDSAYTPAFIALFLAAAVLGTVLICLDQVAIALGRTASATTRYGVGGAAALAAVVGVAAARGRLDATALVACWTLSAVTAATVGGVQLHRWVGYRYRPGLHLRRMWRMVRVAVPNQMLTLTERLSPAVVPIILAHVVSPTMTAYWYPAWMMAWVAFTAPISVGMVQFADLVKHPEGARKVIVQGMLWSAALGGGLVIVLVVGAGFFLSALGDGYAHASVAALRILAVGLAPFLVLQAYNALCRALNRLGEAIVLGGFVIASVCAGTALLGHLGTTAVALVWVGSTGLAALWALWRLHVGLRVVDARFTAGDAAGDAAGGPRG